MVVGDTDGCPYSAYVVLALSEYLEVPYLILVSDGQALAPVTVTVLLDELSHQAYGVTGR